MKKKQQTPKENNTKKMKKNVSRRQKLTSRYEPLTLPHCVLARMCLCVCFTNWPTSDGIDNILVSQWQETHKWVRDGVREIKPESGVSRNCISDSDGGGKCER